MIPKWNLAGIWWGRLELATLVLAEGLVLVNMVMVILVSWMMRDFLVSCVAAAHQEGFFSVDLINIDCEETDYRTRSSSKEGRRLWEDIRETMAWKWAKVP